jgi:hypothetical protein
MIISVLLPTPTCSDQRVSPFRTQDPDGYATGADPT